MNKKYFAFTHEQMFNNPNINEHKSEFFETYKEAYKWLEKQEAISLERKDWFMVENGIDPINLKHN